MAIQLEIFNLENVLLYSDFKKNIVYVSYNNNKKLQAIYVKYVKTIFNNFMSEQLYTNITPIQERKTTSGMSGSEIGSHVAGKEKWCKPNQNIIISIQ